MAVARLAPLIFWVRRQSGASGLSTSSPYKTFNKKIQTNNNRIFNLVLDSKNRHIQKPNVSLSRLFCIAIPSNCIAITTVRIAVPTGMYRYTDKALKQECYCDVLIKAKKRSETVSLYRLISTFEQIPSDAMYRYTYKSHDACEMHHCPIGSNKPARCDNSGLL